MFKRLRRLWSASILVRASLIVLAGIGVAGVLFIYLSAPVIGQRAVAQAHARLGEMLDTVERTASIACFAGDRGLAQEVANGLIKSPEVAGIAIRCDENVLAQVRRDMPAATTEAEYAPIRRSIRSPFDADVLLGEIVLRVNGAEIDKRVSADLGFAGLMLSVLAMVLALAAVVSMLAMVVRPIKKLSDSLHDMDPGAGQRLRPSPAHAHDELGRLAHDINGLADRLVAALEEERRVRQRSELEERKYHAIFDNSEAGIFIVDAQGGVASHNAAFLHMAGGDPATATQLRRLPWSDAEAVAANVASCIRDAISLGGNHELGDPAGNPRWLRLNLAPIGPGLAQGILTDVTELSQARQSAEAASRAKSAFLASMSHELRTPLNAIIGFAQLLEMGASTPLTAEQREPVGQILASGRHLLQLINEVLDLARIEAGRLDLAIADVAVAPLLKEAMALTRPMADVRHISLHLGCPGSLRVRADPARLRQIVLNLLSNAVKYNREDGMVSLACRLVEARLRVTVTDTGRGIPTERRDEVFQPFQRLGAERSQIEGTGVGLVVSRQLAEAMGGWLDFESQMGIGSRFWVDLPAAASAEDEESEAATAAPARPAVARQGRVLYVEDDEGNMLVMRHVIRKMPGVELRISATAEDGLNLALLWRPHLILMDINLPGMSGLEAVERLKANPATAAIPVIAVTAAALPSQVQAGMAAGFLDYLTKPFDVPALLARLAELLPSAAAAATPPDDRTS